MPLLQASARHAMVDAGRRLAAQGLTAGTSGNLGLRLEDGTVMVTPSGAMLESLDPQTLVELDPEGAVLAGGKPTSEWRIHVDVLAAKPEVNAVVHTHAPFCTVLACHSLEIPAFHYMVAAAGGDSVPCAPYATFGTEDLSHGVVAALSDRRACLMAHHGMVAVGASLDLAVALAATVEELAAQFWRVLQLGKPQLLDAEEMIRVNDRFRSYGAAK